MLRSCGNKVIGFPIAANGHGYPRRACLRENKMTRNETRSVRCASATKILCPWRSPSRPDLEEAKQFEYDYNNDNYSDYVEDASVHAVD
jgi:hypothetical protein